MATNWPPCRPRAAMHARPTGFPRPRHGGWPCSPHDVWQFPAQDAKRLLATLPDTCQPCEMSRNSPCLLPRGHSGPRGRSGSVLGERRQPGIPRERVLGQFGRSRHRGSGPIPARGNNLPPPPSYSVLRSSSPVFLPWRMIKIRGCDVISQPPSRAPECGESTNLVNFRPRGPPLPRDRDDRSLCTGTG